MAKKVDYMKYIPIGVMAVSLISGYTLLQSRVGGAEDKIKDIVSEQKSISEDTGEIKVQQAQVSQKVDLIYEAIKDMKQSNRDR